MLMLLLMFLGKILLILLLRPTKGVMGPLAQEEEPPSGVEETCDLLLPLTIILVALLLPALSPLNFVCFFF